MSEISRRDFVKTTATAAAAGLVLATGLDLHASALGLPIGCQTWPVRDMIAKDFPGTIKTLVQAGFQTVELCSPVGYADSGFAGLAKYKGSELKTILNDAGVTCFSSHFGIEELRKDQEDRIAWAKDIGLTQMLVPSLNGPKNPTLDDVKRSADEYNKMGEKAAQAGIQQGLHNEDFELSKVDGQRTYDVLFGLLDPKLVKFQFQVSTISDGYDAAQYFMKYPGRFISMHVQGWDSNKREIVAVGQGTLDWKKIFTAAKTGGVKNLLRGDGPGKDERERAVLAQVAGVKVSDLFSDLRTLRVGALRTTIVITEIRLKQTSAETDFKSYIRQRCGDEFHSRFGLTNHRTCSGRSRNRKDWYH